MTEMSAELRLQFAHDSLRSLRRLLNVYEAALEEISNGEDETSRRIADEALLPEPTQ